MTIDMFAIVDFSYEGRSACGTSHAIVFSCDLC